MKKMYMLEFEYDETAGDNINEVFNVDVDKFMKKVEAILNSDEKTFTQSVVSRIETNEITGNEFLFLACLGLRRGCEKMKQKELIGDMLKRLLGE